MTERIDLAHWIAGEAVAAPATYFQENPADPGDLRVGVPEAGEALIDDAIAAARGAVAELERQGIERRADALAAIARALFARADELAELIARETGKLLGDAKGEVGRAARIFDFFAGETLRNAGERFASTRPGVTVEVAYAPVGVTGLITPWNFPIAIPAWKIAPALAYGNAVVWKPSELSSAVADALMRMVAGSGLPAGAVNMLLGGGAAGAALAGKASLDALSFTGSERTGRALRMAAAANNVRVQTEMGGVNGLIVLADADVDNAVDCIVNGAFFAAGQRCTATSRIIVEEASADALSERLVARIAALPMGDPRAAGTMVGPLVSPGQKSGVAAAVRAAEASGLRPAIGGSAVEAPHAFFPPTLFLDVPHDHPLGQEEIFGPVAGLFRVADFDSAIALLNGNRFGLSAGLCTRSLAYAEAFKARAHAGMLMINQPTAGVDYHAPFGGRGASSQGAREQGRAAREFYTATVTSYQLPL
jgi:aldehyde dehydrogenase (NAD+)